jgi:hypothetical protein
LTALDISPKRAVFSRQTQISLFILLPYGRY